MKKKKIAVLMLIFTLLFGGCKFTVSFTQPDNTERFKSTVADYESSHSNLGYYYKKLSNDEKIAYINVISAAESFSDTAICPELTKEQLNNIASAVSYDNPYLFWLSISWKYSKTGDDCVIFIPYTHSPEECQRMKLELDRKISEFFVGINLDISDYEKELCIHDRLIDICSYANSPAESQKPEIYTAYGALVEGRSVCEGYSKAFKLLLERAGISSIIMTGVGIDSLSIETSHMWNAVLVGENYYHVDTTWDDPTSADGSSALRHSYFNLTDREISADHRFESDILCNSTEYNYFKRNNLYFSGCLPNNFNDDIAEKLYMLRMKNSDFLELRFSDSALYNEAKFKLFDEYLIYSCLAYANLKYNADFRTDSVSFSNIDANFTIGIKFKHGSK